MNPSDLTHLQREVYYELRRRNGAATNHELAKVAGHRFGARVHELNKKGFDIINEPVPNDFAKGIRGVTLYAMLGVPQDWKKNSAAPPPADINGESRVPGSAELGDVRIDIRRPVNSEPGTVHSAPGRSTVSPRRTSTRPNGDLSKKPRKLPMPRRIDRPMRSGKKHDWKRRPRKEMWGGSEYGFRCTICSIVVLDPRNWEWSCFGELTRKAS